MNTIELVQQDITELEIECIVNASNESGLGCHRPGHPCIDNAIHKKAGPGLLEECKTLNGIPTGCAKITKAYNLPSKYIIHVTGPKISDGEDYQMLGQCYHRVLDLCKEHQIKEIAFCCLSTGIFGYENEPSARVALQSIREWLEKNQDVRFNKILIVTYKDIDFNIYSKLLAQYDEPLSVWTKYNLTCICLILILITMIVFYTRSGSGSGSGSGSDF